MKIDIGTDTSGGGVVIDLERLLDGRLLVQAASRSGKSWLLRRLCEQAWGHVQQIVVDLEGEYVTLADVFGHIVVGADEIERAGPEAIAQTARQHRVSLIVDLSGAERSDQAEMATRFLRGLVAAPEEFWKPALVIVDEAHLLAPHGASSGTPEHLRKAAVAALTDLMARGSKRGLIGVVATQRLAKIAKSVVAEALNIAIGRNNMDLDVRRAADLLGLPIGQAELQLRRLQPGEFYVLGDAVADIPTRISVGPVESEHRGRTPELDAPPLIDADTAADLFAALPDADEMEDNSADATAPDKQAASRRRRSNGWTEVQLATLREGAATGRDRREIARDVGRSLNSVYTKSFELGLQGPAVKSENAWSDEEKAVIRAGYDAGLTRRQILEQLPDPSRRTIQGIGYIAGELGLNKAPAPWSDAEIETMRRIIEDEGGDRNDVAKALGRPAAGVSSMMTKHHLHSRNPWRPAEYDLLRRRHGEGVRMVDVARELDRPYANVAKIAEKMKLSFRAAAQDNRQSESRRPLRVPRERMLEMARANHLLVRTTSGGYLVDGKYSYTEDQLLALVNRERAAAGEGPVSVPPESVADLRTRAAPAPKPPRVVDGKQPARLFHDDPRAAADTRR